MKPTFILLLFMIVISNAHAATCEPGQYVSGNECVVCGNSSGASVYCPDGVTVQYCPTSYVGGNGSVWCPPNKWSDRYSPLGCSKITHCVDASVPYVSAHGSGVRHYFWNEETEAYDIPENIELRKCDAGYYKNTTTTANPSDCSVVGYGYYSPIDDINRTACPVGKSTHTTTAVSDSECEDLCDAGITELHIGNSVFPIWKNKPSSVALNISYNGKTCYVALDTGVVSGALNISFGGKTYHTTN